MSFAARWDRYWFRPEPAVNLAACRVLVVGYQLFVLLFPWTVLNFPPLEMFAQHVQYPDELYHPPWIVRLLTLPLGLDYRPTLPQLEWAYRLTIVLGVPALLGWWTRTSCLLFAAGNLFILAHAYSYGEYHHIECLSMIALVLFAASPSGAALSLDARRRARAGHSHLGLLVPRWPRLLMVWMFAMIYLSGALCKLGAAGLDWMNGHTLQYYLLQNGLFYYTPGVWIAEHLEWCIVLSWFTLVAEGLFWLVLIWPRLYWLFVPACAAMHLGIFLTLRASFLHYLVLYSVFVPWHRLLRRGIGFCRPEER